MNNSEYVGDRQYIILGYRNGNGLHTEIAGRFNESVFRENYYNAFVNVAKLIRYADHFTSDDYDDDIDGDEREGRKNCCCNQEYYYSLIRGRDVLQKRLVDERFYNAIGFFGERGLGKTSVMYSFVKSLRENKYGKFIEQYQNLYGLDDNDKDTSLVQILNEYEYYPLDVIDVSLLEEKESIVDVILTKIYDEFKSIIDFLPGKNWEVDGHLCTPDDVLKLIASVYDGYHLVRSGKTNETARRFSVEILNGLSGSLHVRRNIYKLIQSFLGVTGKKNANKFLVICIDDIDLSTHGFELLEDLHRYFMIPNVIICLTANSKDLHRICVRHFKETHGIKEKGDGFSEANEMAITYLEKVLPVNNRIHLHSLLDRNCRIKVTRNSKEEWTIKEYTLHMIADRSLAYFDGIGLKKHFYEMPNLRALNNLYQMLDEMPIVQNHMSILRDSLGANNDSELTTIEKTRRKGLYNRIETNLSKLHDDIMDRMVTEKITSNEAQDVFDKFCREDMARRGSLLIDWILAHIGKGTFNDEYTKYGYNYGKLIRAINVLSDEKQELKGFIHCLLAECTIAMTRLYYSEIMLGDIDPDYHGRVSKEWEQMLGDSVVGSYGNKIFPDIDLMASDKPNRNSHFGYEENREYLLDDRIVLKHKLVYILDKDYSYKKNDGDPHRFVEWVDDLINDQNIRFADVLFFVCMFLRKCEYDKAADLKMPFIFEKSSLFKVRKLPDEGVTQKTDDEIVLKPNVLKCNFDVFGFVLNTRNLKDYADAIRNMIKNIFVYYGRESYEKWADTYEKEIENLTKRITFYGTKEFYLFNGNEYALPLHCADIMYNIFKRVRKYMREKYGSVVDYEGDKDDYNTTQNESRSRRKRQKLGSNIETGNRMDNKDLQNIQSKSVSDKTMVLMIKDCFEAIKKELGEEDRFYGIVDSATKNKSIHSMQAMFAMHPLVQFILNYENAEKSGNEIPMPCKKLFANMLRFFALESMASTEPTERIPGRVEKQEAPRPQSAEGHPEGDENFKAEDGFPESKKPTGSNDTQGAVDL